MNDLDLRTALHRDADLAGSPSPDLLEQLQLRRQRQSRRRIGAVSAVLGVVVLAAGIPLGQSLVVRSDGAPAGQPVITPTPAVTSEVPTPTVAQPDPTVEAPPTVAEAPATSAPAVVSDGLPVCPDTDTLIAAMPELDSDDIWYAAGNELNPPTVPQCAGDLAVTTVFRAYYEQPGTTVNGVPVQPGDVGMTGGVGLFRFVEGAWTVVDREEYCDSGLVPGDIRSWTCETS
jgi:hypothetical protein